MWSTIDDMNGEAAKKLSTLDDLLAMPDDQRNHELIDGEIVERAAPSIEHGGVQFALAGVLHGPFRRSGSGGGATGWWFGAEVDVLLPTGDLVRPDLVGWRRDRHPSRPTGTPVRALPDWICEVVSPSHARNDTVRKVRTYHRAVVPHYWLVDGRDDTLTVYRWTPEGYLVALSAEREERVRAEPFEAIEIAVGELFGDETA